MYNPKLLHLLTNAVYVVLFCSIRFPKCCSLNKPSSGDSITVGKQDIYSDINKHHREICSRGQLKCDGSRTETRFCLSAKRTNPFKSAGASVQSTTGSRGVRISGSNAGYTIFRGSVKGTVYPLYSPVSPSLPLPCVTVCHYISTGLYYFHAA
jgi:hypothetical protein